MSGKPCTCPGGYASHYRGCVFRTRLLCGCTGGLCDHECHREHPCTHCTAQHAEPPEQLRSEATPKEPAAPTAAALLSREELEGMERDLATLGMQAPSFRVPAIAISRLVATALAGIEARADADRLDWLQEQVYGARPENGIQPIGTVILDGTWTRPHCHVEVGAKLYQGHADTLRQAIDKARTEMRQ